MARKIVQKIKRKDSGSEISGGCVFCEGTGCHWGKVCGACDGTGKERVRRQLQKVYNAKEGLALNYNLNID